MYSYRLSNSFFCLVPRGFCGCDMNMYKHHSLDIQIGNKLEKGKTHLAQKYENYAHRDTSRLWYLLSWPC